MEQLLTSLAPGQDRIQYLFLVGEYHRQLGDFEKARTCFRDARSTVWIDDDGAKQTGHSYFDELVAEREQLLPRERLPD